MAERRLGDLLARLAAGETLTPAEANQIRLLANALQNLIGLSSKVDPLTGDITGELRAGPTVLGRDGLTAGNGEVYIDEDGMTAGDGNVKLSTGGVQLVQGSGASNMIRWVTAMSGGSEVGYAACVTVGSAPDRRGSVLLEGRSEAGAADGNAGEAVLVSLKRVGGADVLASEVYVVGQVASIIVFDADGATPLSEADFGAAGIVLNEMGADSDLRVEGDTNTNLFKLDAGLDCVGVGGAPTTNCVLDVVSTTKAFRPPVMNTTQRDAIGTPVAGMVIYNTSMGVLNFYNGAAWGAV